jgi:hypothetical protein
MSDALRQRQSALRQAGWRRAARAGAWRQTMEEHMQSGAGTAGCCCGQGACWSAIHPLRPAIVLEHTQHARLLGTGNSRGANTCIVIGAIAPGGWWSVLCCVMSGVQLEVVFRF